MAMTKKEQAAFDGLKRELAIAKAFDFDDSPIELDLQVPKDSGVYAHGWYFNGHTKIVQPITLNCTGTYRGEHVTRECRKLVWSYDRAPVYSTKELALRALRNYVKREAAEQLAGLNTRILAEQNKVES